MANLGDEFILENYRVPWLIWIQLLVMILLVILLFFGFTVFTLEPSTFSSDATPTPTPPTHLNSPSSTHSGVKAETQRSRGDRVSNTEFAREELGNEEASSSKESSFIRIFRNPKHPCSYFGQAKRAVLKCLGLDSSSEVSSSDHHEKQE